MARSLEGKAFFVGYNNGVTAIVTEDVLENRDKRLAILNALRKDNNPLPHIDRIAEKGLGHIPDSPIFTFARDERADNEPWFTGNNTFLQRVFNHIAKEGGQCIKRSFWIPFSNGAEVGLHGDEAQIEELRYVTTYQNFIDTFAIEEDEI